MATRKPAAARGTPVTPTTARPPAPAAHHERFVAALVAQQDRGNRLAGKLVDSLLAGQRDALAFGAALAADPTAFARHAAAFLAAVNAAQTRAVEVAEVFYHTQSEAAAEFNAAARGLFDAARAGAAPLASYLANLSPHCK